MSTVDEDRPDELTEHYRAAAAADPARPSEAVRRSILAHARAVASEPAARDSTRARSGRVAARNFRWPLSAAASVIVAAFAAILAWHVHAPPTPSSPTAQHQAASTPAPPSQPPEPFPLDRPAAVPPAADRGATAPRPRIPASAEAARSTRDAPADLSREGESAASSRQSPAALTGANSTDSAAAPGNAEERSTRARSAAASPPPAAAQLRSVEAADAAGSAVAKEAVHPIDWAALGPGFPIPASMPTASSDDPREAGFSPEWARRALKGVEAPPQLQRAGAGASAEKLALAIMSRKRAPDDEWAREVERRLREVIRAEVDTQGPTVSRVFCNDVGCLCYTERNGENANAAGFAAISETLGRGSGWSRELGIDLRSVYVFATGGPADLPTRAVWQMVFVMRSVRPQN